MELYLVPLLLPLTSGLLYPQDTPTRDTKTLDGLWMFQPDPAGVGVEEAWFSRPLAGAGLQEMPVPSSYNDLGTAAELRELVGVVWYQRQVLVPASWLEDTRLMLRFGSVHYEAEVWLGGARVGGHQGGHMAFEMEVTEAVLAAGRGPLLLTVAVNNTLTPATVPQGRLVTHAEYTEMETQFDFFNYAGIHRPVTLYRTPEKIYIQDITTSTRVNQDLSAQFTYNVSYFLKNEEKENIKCVIQLLGKEEIIDIS